MLRPVHLLKSELPGCECGVRRGDPCFSHAGFPVRWTWARCVMVTCELGNKDRCFHVAVFFPVVVAAHVGGPLKLVVKCVVWSGKLAVIFQCRREWRVRRIVNWRGLFEDHVSYFSTISTPPPSCSFQSLSRYCCVGFLPEVCRECGMWGKRSGGVIYVT